MALAKCWWHRLAVVTYSTSLVMFACCVWLLRADAPYRPGWTQSKWIPGGETTDAVSKKIRHGVYEASNKVVFFGPDGTLRLVQYNLVKEAVEDGGHRAIPMVLNDSFAYVPDYGASEAAKAGAHVVSLPQDYVLAGNDIPYWYLQRHPRWWQVLVELYGVVLFATLAFSYVLQIAYRAFVYIVRGNWSALP
jgi:hypothetical protein